MYRVEYFDNDTGQVVKFTSIDRNKAIAKMDAVIDGVPSGVSSVSAYQVEFRNGAWVRMIDEALEKAMGIYDPNKVA